MEKSSSGVRRKPLRKRQLEDTRESDSEGSSDLSSSSADEAEYDATCQYIYTNIGVSEDPQVDNGTGRFRPAWNRLSCIEERSCAGEGLDSDDIPNSDAEEDFVVHFADDDDKTVKTPIFEPLTNQQLPVAARTNQITVEQEQINTSLTDYTTDAVGNLGTSEQINDTEKTNIRFIQTGEVSLEQNVTKTELPCFDVQTECIVASSSSTEEEDMTMRMPGYPPDIPEGKRKYLQHRHHVSALDETNSQSSEYRPKYITKRGSTKAVMQSFSSDDRPEASIGQAETTTSHRNYAPSRGTVKGVGLTNQSATGNKARSPISPFNEEGQDEINVHIDLAGHVGCNPLSTDISSLPAFTPRIELPRKPTTTNKRSDIEELRRARHDHFLSKPHNETGTCGEDIFFMGDEGDIETAPPTSPMTEPLKRRYWRLKSLPSNGYAPQVQPPQSKTTHMSRSVSRLHKQINGSNRMYSRSGSRYRSTDIDAALASSRELLMESSFIEEDRKDASLFDLTAKQGCLGTSRNLRNSPSNPSNLQLLNGKSNNSLLETDIDTGEQSGQPIILETDVDTLNTYQVVLNTNKDKSYSLFNLTNLSTTPSCHRRFMGVDMGERSRKGAYERAQSLQGIHNDEDVKTESKSSTSGSRGLIARLKARATSTHELRVAESLTRLHLPDWLDKADLTKPLIPSRDNSMRSSLSRSREQLPIPRYSRSESRTQLLPNTSEINPIQQITVETISKPLWSPAPRKIAEEDRKSLRPSQAIRERDTAISSKLMPISSKLKNSMRSLGSNDLASPIDRGPVLKANTPNAALTRLAPDDFLTHGQKVWGDKPPHTKSPIPPVYHQNGSVIASAELVQAPRSPHTNPSSLSKPAQKATPPTNEMLIRVNGDTHIQQVKYERRFPPTTSEDSIQMADDDAVSELFENEFYHTNDSDIRLRYDDRCIYEKVDQHKVRQPPPPINIKPTEKIMNGDGNAYKKTSPPPIDVQLSPMSISPPMTPPWREIDEDGETETKATDGLDKISTLTCLTDLIDKCSTRHLLLLQNRPSALENMLAQLGWWPSVPSTTNQRFNQLSAEQIALAAGRFDPSEDGHRHEFLALLASPAGQGPVILTEFGFDQLRIGIDRNPKDGMLYLHCTSPNCPRVGPTRVDRARSWVTCTNCYAAYCSPNCRIESASSHGSVCSFGRARLACGRILHHLSIGQLSSLTVLAKAGMARLGKGGILLAFSSVQHAEFFYIRCTSLPNHPGAELTVPKDNMAAADRPSPSGLMAAPIYLTAKELNDLDSKCGLLCRTYTPSNSLVLIAIVCAYDLETVGNGRTVHLFKQSIILPFPTGTTVQPTSDVYKLNNTVSWTQAKTTREEREVFFKKLQRTLRERGVSLRNHHKDEYRQLTRFVETGEPFEPIEFEFHDYIAEQMVKCTLAPMREAILQPQPRSFSPRPNQQSSSQKPTQRPESRKTFFASNIHRRTAETEL